MFKPQSKEIITKYFSLNMLSNINLDKLLGNILIDTQKVFSSKELMFLY